MTKEKPMFADGSIVADYNPLFKYWELARKKSRKLAEKAVINNEDFEFLRRLLEEKSNEIITLVDILNTLIRKVLDRIDPDVAREAYKELYNVELDGEDAQNRIAKIIAGWLVEAGKTWGMLRLRGRLPRD